MIQLQDETIVLRALEPQDLSYFMTLENDSSMWRVCDTRIPFSKFVLERVMETTHSDIFSEKQLRLVVCAVDDGRQLGFVDLYDFSPLHHRTGIGVVIWPADQRRKGYAAKALRLAIDYAFDAFNVHQVWADVAADNVESNELFKNLGFELCGIKPHWQLIKGKYIDVNTYHLISENRK